MSVLPHASHKPHKKGPESSNNWFAVIYLASSSHNQIPETSIISLASSGEALCVTALSVTILFINKHRNRDAVPRIWHFLSISCPPSVDFSWRMYQTPQEPLQGEIHFASVNPATINPPENIYFYIYINIIFTVSESHQGAEGQT